MKRNSSPAFLIVGAQHAAPLLGKTILASPPSRSSRLLAFQQLWRCTACIPGGRVSRRKRFHGSFFNKSIASSSGGGSCGSIGVGGVSCGSFAIATRFYSRGLIYLNFVQSPKWRHRFRF